MWISSHDRHSGSGNALVLHQSFIRCPRTDDEPDGWAASRSTTIDHALIRGLGTAFPISVLGLPRSKDGRRSQPALAYSEDYPSCLVFAARPSGSMNRAGTCVRQASCAAPSNSAIKNHRKPVASRAQAQKSNTTSPLPTASACSPPSGRPQRRSGLPVWRSSRGYRASTSMAFSPAANHRQTPGYR